jgi:hypothetical protein
MNMIQESSEPILSPGRGGGRAGAASGAGRGGGKSGGSGGARGPGPRRYLDGGGGGVGGGLGNPHVAARSPNIPGLRVPANPNSLLGVTSAFMF